ncbi:hypothetical protein PAUR_a3472 [Pseudoalteromonas aurantia 208]|uniref:Transposase n=1 Tax=Pseudoalteromonas aurantia 208 TaxID=1314867 RepID=A0ABR9E6N1_9GAMM|nr:hypothetical protein [Pseudoalteromonas aurantia 208]
MRKLNTQIKSLHRKMPVSDWHFFMVFYHNKLLKTVVGESVYRKHL